MRVRHLASVLILLAGAACSPAPDSGETNASLQAALAELNELRQEKQTRERAAAEGRPKQTSSSTANNPVSTASSDPEPEPEPVDLCWQDYCPCEPPQGGPDQGICRQLRAGLQVDEELMAAAAMMRDARRQLDEFEAEHGEFR